MTIAAELHRLLSDYGIRPGSDVSQVPTDELLDRLEDAAHVLGETGRGSPLFEWRLSTWAELERRGVGRAVLAERSGVGRPAVDKAFSIAHQGEA